MHKKPIVKLITCYRTEEGNKQANLVLDKLRINIFGGPSLIIYRMHCASVTRIIQLTFEENKCEFVVDTRSHRLSYRILGFYANTLYM